MTEFDQGVMVRDALALVIAERLSAAHDVRCCSLSPRDWQRLLVEVIDWPRQVVCVAPADISGKSGEQSLFVAFCGRQVEVRCDGLQRDGVVNFEVPA